MIESHSSHLSSCKIVERLIVVSSYIWERLLSNGMERRGMLVVTVTAVTSVRELALLTEGGSRT